MELLNGDRPTSSPTDLPQHISPFLATGDLLVSVSSPTAVVHSPDNGTNFPPQKLRPIRAPSSSLTATGGYMDQYGGDVSAYLDSPTKAEDGDVAVNSGWAQSPAVVGVESCADRENGDLNWDEGLLKEESSAPLDDDDDDDDDDNNADSLSLGTNDPSSRKRKWKERKNLEGFLKSLVVKVMEKQEQMHNQLIEMIERRERERLIREEAWKQQEMERMKRDAEVRAQETSRNLALISFIQNVMVHGPGIEAPQPLNTFSPVMNNVAVQNDSTCKPSNKRWPESEVQALITLRTALEQKLNVTGSKSHNIWDAISAGMHNMGYNRTSKKCKEKWENINKYFKKSLGNRQKSLKNPDENGKARPYFQELDGLYSNGLSNMSNIANDMVSEMKPVAVADKD